MTPVRVGLVGAGRWAALMHAPMLATGPETVLAGVWSRRSDAAARLARRHGVARYARLEDLAAACDAVAFAVPPAVQPQLACAVAGLGRPLLLEKPLASDLAGARRLVEAIEEAGVATQLVLTLRYTTAVRGFLAAATALTPEGGQAQWISRGTLDPDAAPWRRQAGALLDVGPHVLDLLDAALGRIRGVRAHGTRSGWVGLLLDHEGGAVSQVSMSSQVAIAEPLCRVAVGGRGGGVVLDTLPVDQGTSPRIAAEFAATVRRGGGHPLDAHHGLHLQEVVAAAMAQLGAR